MDLDVIGTSRCILWLGEKSSYQDTGLSVGHMKIAICRASGGEEILSEKHSGAAGHIHPQVHQ